MLSISDNNQAYVDESINSTSRNLDDLLDIINLLFKQMVGQKYSTELMQSLYRALYSTCSLAL